MTIFVGAGQAKHDHLEDSQIKKVHVVHMVVHALQGNIILTNEASSRSHLYPAAAGALALKSAIWSR